jgi:FixJ family two-component response regulator
MRGGAEDFLEKRAPKEHLLAAVREALERDGARAGRAQPHNELASASRRSARARARGARLGAAGPLNKQIAGDLGIHGGPSRFIASRS